MAEKHFVVLSPVDKHKAYTVVFHGCDLPYIVVPAVDAEELAGRWGMDICGDVTVNCSKEKAAVKPDKKEA